jgi:hypothetical protein
VLDHLHSSSSSREIASRSLIAALLIHLLLIGFHFATTRSPPHPTKPTWYSQPQVEVGPPPERFQHIPLPAEVPPVIPPMAPRPPLNPRERLTVLPPILCPGPSFPNVWRRPVHASL